jgi:hypothetical protein
MIQNRLSFVFAPVLYIIFIRCNILQNGLELLTDVSEVLYYKSTKANDCMQALLFDFHNLNGLILLEC